MTSPLPDLASLGDGGHIDDHNLIVAAIATKADTTAVESAIEDAVASKAEQSAVDSLASIVATKAEQSTVATLTADVTTKLDADDAAATYATQDDLADEAVVRGDDDAAHAAGTDPHALAKYAIMPDGGRRIWVRPVAPTAEDGAIDGDVWIDTA